MPFSPDSIESSRSSRSSLTTLQDPLQDISKHVDTVRWPSRRIKISRYVGSYQTLRPKSPSHSEHWSLIFLSRRPPTDSAMSLKQANNRESEESSMPLDILSRQWPGGQTRLRADDTAKRQTTSSHLDEASHHVREGSRLTGQGFTVLEHYSTSEASQL